MRSILSTRPNLVKRARLDDGRWVGMGLFPLPEPVAFAEADPFP